MEVYVMVNLETGECLYCCWPEAMTLKQLGWIEREPTNDR